MRHSRGVGGGPVGAIREGAHLQGLGQGPLPGSGLSPRPQVRCFPRPRASCTSPPLRDRGGQPSLWSAPSGVPARWKAGALLGALRAERASPTPGGGGQLLLSTLWPQGHWMQTDPPGHGAARPAATPSTALGSTRRRTARTQCLPSAGRVEGKSSPSASLQTHIRESCGTAALRRACCPPNAPLLVQGDSGLLGPSPWALSA